MNRKSWIALILATAIILTAACAAADAYPLKRGSKGDEVKALQEMLIDLGFLQDEPDGIFGKKTESAAKAWQKFRGVKQTGRMTSDEMTVLDETWSLVMDVATEASATEEELKAIFVSGCCPYENDGVTHFEYCYRHYRAIGLADLLQNKRINETMESKCAERLASLWLNYISGMYDEWEKNVPSSQKHVAQEQRALFESSLEEKRKEWETGSSHPLAEEALWLNEIGVGLCFDMHTAEANLP